MTRREWIKVHLISGVKTNVVTAVETRIVMRTTARSLSRWSITAENFVMQEVSADKLICRQRIYKRLWTITRCRISLLRLTVFRNGPLD